MRDAKGLSILSWVGTLETKYCAKLNHSWGDYESNGTWLRLHFVSPTWSLVYSTWDPQASYSTVVTVVTVTVSVVDQICWMEKEQTDSLLTCTTGIQSSHYESGMWFALLYKHQWNTRWAFEWKLDIFTCENNMLSSHVKISLLLWLHNKSRLSHRKTIKVKWFGISLEFI